MARVSNRMSEAVTKLADRFANYAAITITYGRGDTSIPGISATVGQTSFDVETDGVMVSYQSRDYILPASALTVGGQQWYPQAGDYVTESDGSVHAVAAPQPMDVYERIGPNGSVLKIHTKGPR